jgi:hypothetical protein
MLIATLLNKLSEESATLYSNVLSAAARKVIGGEFAVAPSPPGPSPSSKYCNCVLFGVVKVPRFFGCPLYNYNTCRICCRHVECIDCSQLVTALRAFCSHTTLNREASIQRIVDAPLVESLVVDLLPSKPDTLPSLTLVAKNNFTLSCASTSVECGDLLCVHVRGIHRVTISTRVPGESLVLYDLVLEDCIVGAVRKEGARFVFDESVPVLSPPPDEELEWSSSSSSPSLLKLSQSIGIAPRSSFHSSFPDDVIFLTHDTTNDTYVVESTLLRAVLFVHPVTRAIHFVFGSSVFALREQKEQMYVAKLVVSSCLDHTVVVESDSSNLRDHYGDAVPCLHASHLRDVRTNSTDRDFFSLRLKYRKI